MDRQIEQNAFPIKAVLFALTVAAVTSGAVAFAVIWWTVDVDEAAAAVPFAAIVVWVGAVLAIVPVALVSQRGTSATISAYLAGMIGRILFCLLGALVGVELLELPSTSTLLSMVGIYLVMLLLDAALISRYLSGSDSPPGTAGGTGNEGSGDGSSSDSEVPA